MLYSPCVIKAITWVRPSIFAHFCTVSLQSAVTFVTIVAYCLSPIMEQR